MSDACRILYVDDDAGLRRLVQRALIRRGYAVETAESADDALDQLERAPADLVAVDYYMPEKTGLDLLKILSARDDAPPVVIVTGSDDTRIAVTALKEGAADFVVKVVGEDFIDLLARSFDQALERVALVRAKAAAERDLVAANARLESLLGEVHHRVANSLQMVSSFVTLQMSRSADEATRQALERTQARIHAVSQVHQRLYTSQSTETIELDGYLETLLDALRGSFAGTLSNVELTLRAEPASVKPDQAVSIGVIVTELVSNAAKYAFAPGAAGRVEVTLDRTPSGFAVEVSDNGRGFDGSAQAQGTGLGMRIVSAMAQSLRTQLDHVPSVSGSRFRIEVAR